MTPTPQEPTVGTESLLAADGDRIVISGMSGLYPESHNVNELSDILYNKGEIEIISILRTVNVLTKPSNFLQKSRLMDDKNPHWSYYQINNRLINPVTTGTCRWDYNHIELPPYSGIIPDVDRFDAQFFKVHYRLGCNMDPMSKKLLEQAYQAIYDAGVNPDSLSGKNVGVYVGVTVSEWEKHSLYNTKCITGFGVPGNSKSMYANRISYWLNTTGPSLVIDAGCCSALDALKNALMAMKRGECDAAIVGASSLSLHPESSVLYGRTITLNLDGKTKSFDEKADGIAKSEAINVLFLQKSKDALRIYAELLHVKNEFTQIPENEKGYRHGFQRDSKKWANFLDQFYKEVNVSPSAVEYIEGYGTAHPETDKAELEAIEEVFCKERVDPILVGSVTSNIGYCDAASGICSITKVLLGYEKGILAANINCENPRQDIKAIKDKQIKIVTEHTPFRRTLAAVNGLSFTGDNAHALLQGHFKPKDSSRYKSDIPYLVTISGRQESAVQKVADLLKSQPIDPEQIALLHNIYKQKIKGHLARGFTVLDTQNNETACLREEFQYYDDMKRPLWFVYSGMGSQWAGMGKKLLRIPIFAASIERCRKVLEPKGVDIIEILTSPDKHMFDNILHSFVGIAAVQIGLTDVLKALQIFPDKIIGHSVGELGCAYADGCLTAEEMILSAYSRGLVSIQTPLIVGSMAAVGLGYNQIQALCPPEIEVACHNGPESSTISGPAEIMMEFVAKLTEQGIFAREVPCSNIAYHSRYIADAGPKLHEYLSQVITNPKPRSERWVSTSIPVDRWNEENAKLCSAWYHTNNLLSPVLFEETSRQIPSNAVTIEIAPHGLLQAILKRSLSPNCKHIALTKRGHSDNVVYLLEALGNIFVEGFNPKLEALYPKVEFPVSTGTPMLSHFTEWNHAEQWPVNPRKTEKSSNTTTCNFVISVHDDEYKYLRGNIVGGKRVYPFSAALVAVWDAWAMSEGVAKKTPSVEFSNIHLLSQPFLLEHRHLRITVIISTGTGKFEVTNEGYKVMTGIISYLAKPAESSSSKSQKVEKMELDSDSIYRLFKERGFSYKDDFRGIHKANSNFTASLLVWKENWVTLIDSMIQLNTLSHNYNAVSQPRNIKKIVIDVKSHSDAMEVPYNQPVVLAERSDLLRFVKCGGVSMEKIEFYDVPLQVPKQFKLKALKFIPHFQSHIPTINILLDVFVQIIAENVNKNLIHIVEITDDYQSILGKDNNILNDTENYKLFHDLIDKDDILQKQSLLEADAIIVRNLSTDKKMVEVLKRILAPNTFVVNEEENTQGNSVLSRSVYKVLNKHTVRYSQIELARWKPIEHQDTTTSIFVHTESDIQKVISLQSSLKPNQRLEVYTTYPPVPRLKNLIQEWRKKSQNNNIYLVMVSGNPKQVESTKLSLAVNVVKSDVWGGEYYINWEESVAMERGMTLESVKNGDLNSLKWIEMPELTDTGVSVAIRYAGINDNDAKRAMGLVKSDQKDHGFGMEYSGTTDRGEQVMGLVRGGAISGRVVAIPELLWPVPAHWTLEDAATVPLAYVQAFYCLAIRSQLLPGMTVLVHGGAGALGQAAITIALANKCRVFTTVGTVHKKKFLQKIFPELDESHIGNSRDHTFGDMVLQATDGLGCDIVISCVKGGLKNVTLKCASFCGITFDMVQANSDDNYTYGMYNMTKQRSFVIVDIKTIFEHKDEMKTMISEGINRGYVRPLSRVTYSAQEAQRAFRLLAASRHRGRVLLRLRDSIIAAQPRLACSPFLTHVVICDEDGFGLQLANRLVERGVKKLRVHLSKQLHIVNKKVTSWRDSGIDVEIISEDLSTNKGVADLLYNINLIEGIYLVASAVPTTQLHSVISNLDKLSRGKISPLKYFAILRGDSDIAQQICTKRASEKLPITSIYIPMLSNYLLNMELLALSFGSALDAIECALRSAEHSLLLAAPREETRQSMLQQLCYVADIRISSNIPDSVTLIDLGLDDSKIEALQFFIYSNYNLWINSSEIPVLTVAKIKNLEDLVTEPILPEARGLETFYSDVDSDELRATSEIVFLHTLFKEAATGNAEVTFDEPHLYIIPGLEGNYNRFNLLCERLKIPAVVLQPDIYHCQDSVLESAQRYTKTLLKKARIQNNYYLLAYEAGILTALQIASILEDQGITGTIYCVGHTPEELKELVEYSLSEIDGEVALQKAIVSHMYKIMVGDVPSNLNVALENTYSWDERLDVGVQMILGHISYSKEYARSLMKSAYERIVQVRGYKLRPQQLSSRIVLIRAASSVAPKTDLQLYSKYPILEYNVHTPLAHVSQHPMCAAIVNRNLDKNIQETYENKNICMAFQTCL